MCTDVETVKQSLNSIETNQELFHSLNAHHHNYMNPGYFTLAAIDLNP